MEGNSIQMLAAMLLSSTSSLII